MPKPQPLKPITMNAARRKFLLDHVKRTIDAPKEKAAMIKAHERVLLLTSSLVLVRYPAKDMKVLERYGVSIETGSIAVQYPDSTETARRPDGNYRTVKYERNNQGFYDDLDWRPNHTDFALPLRGVAVPCGHRSDVFVTVGRDDVVVDAYLAWRKSVHTYRDARDQKRKDYATLVGAVKLFSEITDVWKDALTLHAQVDVVGAPQLPAVVDPAAIERIRADVKMRARARA